MLISRGGRTGWYWLNVSRFVLDEPFFLVKWHGFCICSLNLAWRVFGPGQLLQIHHGGNIGRRNVWIDHQGTTGLPFDQHAIRINFVDSYTCENTVVNCELFVKCIDCTCQTLRQALETQAVQFKLPGLQAFELELGLATAVRALNTCCIIFFCGEFSVCCGYFVWNSTNIQFFRLGSLSILFDPWSSSMPKKMRWCEEDGQGGQGILQHRAWAHAPHLQRPSAEGLGHSGVLRRQGSCNRMTWFDREIQTCSQIDTFETKIRRWRVVQDPQCLWLSCREGSWVPRYACCRHCSARLFMLIKGSSRCCLAP